MASTFEDLYSDFKSLAKIYTEKIDVTPLQFMRFLTRGLQIFQRKTELIETVLVLEQTGTAPNQYYAVPEEMRRLVELRDVGDYPILIQDFEQYKRVVDKWEDAVTETPIDFLQKVSYNVAKDGQDCRVATIWDRKILVYPWVNDANLSLWYIPDVQTISPNSFQWSVWFDGTDETFNSYFRTASIADPLLPYEQAFVDYALSLFLKAAGSEAYIAFERSFEKEIRNAIDEKPVLFRDAVASYKLAPYS